MPVCLMEDITKTYRFGEEDVKVLKGISVRIDQGEFVAIMGPSGSGKTTLMNIIGCLDVPTSGRYLLAGQEVSSLGDDELSEIRSEHIGFIFQNFYLLPYATVLENVLLPSLYASGFDRKSQEKALGFLKVVGLEERARFRPNQLSGGQQQRVAIARALMNDPELLLADEPSGQLDSKTTEEIMRLLGQTTERGKTLVVVTHDREVASYAGRVINISDGMVV